MQAPGSQAQCAGFHDSAGPQLNLHVHAGNAMFFTVKRIEDPIGLLPAKLILGINKRGVHFFRPVPKEYIHSAELRDIMQFGSSSQAVFFKMRVAGECTTSWLQLLFSQVCLESSVHIAWRASLPALVPVLPADVA